MVAVYGSTWWHFGIPEPLALQLFICGLHSFFSKLAISPEQTVLICLPQSVPLSDNENQNGSDCSQAFTSHTGHFYVLELVNN